MARPKAKIDLDEIEKLYGMQCTDEEVAAFLGVSTRTIERRRQSAQFNEVIERAKQLALASIRQSSPVVELLPPPGRPALTHQPEREGPTITVTLHEREQVPVKRGD